MCSFVLIAVFFFSIFSSTWSPFCIAMMPFSSRVSSFKKLYSPVASTTLVEPKRARLTDDISSNIKNIIEARKAHRSWERQNNEKNQQEDSESRGNKGNGRLLDNGILGKRKRNSDGYDPNISRDSKYYKDYCSPRSDRCLVENTKHGKKFRRRFRMPMRSFRYLMEDMRANNWFPDYEKVNALGQVNVLILCLVH
jgi:hypothetical protein